jgi:hypothetical protein
LLLPEVRGDDTHPEMGEETSASQRIRHQQSVRFATLEAEVPTTTQLLYSPRCMPIKSALKHSSSSSSAASGSTDSGFAGSAFADNEGELFFYDSKLSLCCLFVIEYKLVRLGTFREYQPIWVNYARWIFIARSHFYSLFGSCQGRSKVTIKKKDIYIK